MQAPLIVRFHRKLVAFIHMLFDDQVVFGDTGKIARQNRLARYVFYNGISYIETWIIISSGRVSLVIK